jgi:hypothetical protein
MKIITDKEKVYSSYCYSFDLSEYKSNNDKIPIWIQIVFLLYHQKDFNFDSMSAEGDADIGEPRDIIIIEKENAQKYFHNIDVLNNEFTKYELIDWDMYGEYQGVTITLQGDCSNSSIVDLIYPSDSDIDVVSMMQEIESSDI